MKYYQKIDKRQIKLISLNCLLAEKEAEKEEELETNKTKQIKTNTRVKLAISSKYKTDNFYTKPYHKHISSCINSFSANTDSSLSSQNQ